MELYKYLPAKILEYIANHPLKDNITEIRLRSQCIVQLVIDGDIENNSRIYITQNELDEIFYNICKKSINVFEDEISNGFVTLADGARVGISGEYVYSKTSGKYILKKLNSLNIRMPKKQVYFENQDKLFALEPQSTLIIGPPHSGKTSLLRLYCKHLSEKYRITICDERKELYTDKIRCDVISGVPKAIAASMATRTLNPQFIICDEIGTVEEAIQILYSVNTGVKFICSVHGDNLNSVQKKQGISTLFSNNVFYRVVIMQQKKHRFCIEDIIDV